MQGAAAQTALRQAPCTPAAALFTTGRSPDSQSSVQRTEARARLPACAVAAIGVGDGLCPDTLITVAGAVQGLWRVHAPASRFISGVQYAMKHL